MGERDRKSEGKRRRGKDTKKEQERKGRINREEEKMEEGRKGEVEREMMKEEKGGRAREDGEEGVHF